MIKSKGGNVLKSKTTTYEGNTDIRFMAYVRNYECLFCQKKLFLKTFDNEKCKQCGSQWFQKLPDKKAKVVDAI